MDTRRSSDLLCVHDSSQSNGVSNHLMLAQRGKTGDKEGDVKEKEQIPRINLDQITCKDCGEKGHYAWNSYFPTQAKLKEDAKEFRKMNQDKSSNNPPG